MQARIALCLTAAFVAGTARAQCPVSPGTWTGQVGQQHIGFRIASCGTVVDSAAVSFVSACGQPQYSAIDELPVVALQCGTWGFQWSHCRDNPPSTKGFWISVTFDAFDHGTAHVDYLTFGCNGGSCLVDEFIEVTPMTSSVPPDPQIDCQYSGGGTIQYGVSDGGCGVHFDVETASFGAISIGMPPRDLTGPVDTATFPVTCAGAGRGAVTLSIRSGGTLIDLPGVCFECGGAGQTPTEVSCSTGGPSESVEWTQTYSGPSSYGSTTVRQTSDGGYALAGTRNAAFELIKTDPMGAVEWQRTYVVADRILEFGDMEPTGDGGYVLAGQIWVSGQPHDAYLLKVDASGDSEWTQTYGSGSAYETARAVALTSDGGYIVAGHVTSSAPAYDDLFFVKTDASGSIQWTRTHDAGDLEQAFDVQQTLDGGYIVAGYTTGLGAGSYDAYLVKMDAGGIVVWERTYGGVGDDRANSVQETSDGGFVLAGGARSFSANGLEDSYLVRTNATGAELWARTYGGPEREVADVVRETANGGYLLAGDKYTQIGPNLWALSAHATSVTVTGEIIWTETFDDSGEDADVALTSDGGAAVVTGRSPGLLLVKHGPPTPTPVAEVPPRAGRMTLSAYPNPFNPTTRIVFMGVETVRRLAIHDAGGRVVSILDRGTRIPGGRAWTFDAGGLPSGIYTAVLKTDGGDASRKLVLVK